MHKATADFPRGKSCRAAPQLFLHKHVVAHLMKHIATYQIHDTFRITGRGIVFSGNILDGEFMTGDFIKFDFKGQMLERRIKGIDAGMRVVDGKPNVGVMIESSNEQEIDDLRNWNPNLAIGKIYSTNET